MGEERRFRQETADSSGWAELSLEPSRGMSSWPSLAKGMAAGGWLPPGGKCQNVMPWLPEKMGQSVLPH